MAISDKEKFCETLKDSLGELVDKVPQDFIGQCWAHWQLLIEWNEKINLTAILDPAQGALLHYRDSLEAMIRLQGNSFVDFGSGAGFPGIPLALAMPQQDFTLVESRRKRVSFLRVCKSTLGMENLRVLHCRAEDEPKGFFDMALTRATFSNYADIEGLFSWLGEKGSVLVFRTQEDGIDFPQGESHIYELLGRKRTLEIFRRTG